MDLLPFGPVYEKKRKLNHSQMLNIIFKFCHQSNTIIVVFKTSCTNFFVICRTSIQKFTSSISGASLLVYQLFLYPSINKVLGPIKSSRIAAVSKIFRYLIIEFFLFSLHILTAVLDLADPVHTYPLCLPLHDIPVRPWIINHFEYCVSDKE